RFSCRLRLRLDCRLGLRLGWFGAILRLERRFAAPRCGWRRVGCRLPGVGILLCSGHAFVGFPGDFPLCFAAGGRRLSGIVAGDFFRCQGAYADDIGVAAQRHAADAVRVIRFLHAVPRIAAVVPAQIPVGTTDHDDEDNQEYPVHCCHRTLAVALIQRALVGPAHTDHGAMARVNKARIGPDFYPAISRAWSILTLTRRDTPGSAMVTP